MVDSSLLTCSYLDGLRKLVTPCQGLHSVQSAVLIGPCEYLRDVGEERGPNQRRLCLWEYLRLWRGAWVDQGIDWVRVRGADGVEGWQTRGGTSRRGGSRP